MIYRILADLVVIFHFAFVLFVLFGGLLALRWRRVLWAHVPAVLWVIILEFNSLICPLTPLEQRLNEWGGADAYSGGFVDHYIWPVLYPEDLLARYEIDFRTFQIVLGSFVVVLNVAVYGWLVFKWLRRRAAARRTAAGASSSTADVAGEGAQDLQVVTDVDAPVPPATASGPAGRGTGFVT